MPSTPRVASEMMYTVVRKNETGLVANFVSAPEMGRRDDSYSRAAERKGALPR